MNFLSNTARTPTTHLELKRMCRSTKKLSSRRRELQKTHGKSAVASMIVSTETNGTCIDGDADGRSGAFSAFSQPKPRRFLADTSAELSSDQPVTLPLSKTHFSSVAQFFRKTSSVRARYGRCTEGRRRFVMSRSTCKLGACFENRSRTSSSVRPFTWPTCGGGLQDITSAFVVARSR